MKTQGLDQDKILLILLILFITKKNQPSWIFNQSFLMNIQIKNEEILNQLFHFTLFLT